MKQSLLQLLCVLTTLQLAAQLSNQQIQQIDSLFQAWKQPNHPGGAVGVMQNGKVIFSKAYGLASLEYQIPNEPTTIFNTGSVSKQFTAMGIVRLHEQGKLSIDDDIRKHLPEIPDFGSPITIRHMLHHTSGLRSFHAILALAGWRGDDSRSNEDIDRLLTYQKALNFEPGSEYLYCNTGYLLMVNIIEKVTGERFPAWMLENVFKPLGLEDTYVEDQYYRVVPNNATSYRKEDGVFVRAVEYCGYIGSGNMHSTTADLLQWLSNFHIPQDGWASSFELLQTIDPLNDGTPNDYAFGVIVDSAFGQKRVQHGGSIGGFRAYAASYPEQALNITVLTNFTGGGPGQKAAAIAEMLLPTPTVAPKATKKIATPIQLSTAELKKFEGSYWNEQGAYARKIYLKDDTLRYFRSETNESLLVPIAANDFKMLGAGEGVHVKFEGTTAEDKTMSFIDNEETPIVSTYYIPTSLDKADMKNFTGSFYSPEIENTYQIYLDGEELKWHHIRHGAEKMKFLKKDIFSSNWPLSVIRFQRDENDVITGILVSNGRVRNLWMEKVAEK